MQAPQVANDTLGNTSMHLHSGFTAHAATHTVMSVTEYDTY